MATLQSLTISDTGYIKLPVGTGSNRPGSPVNGMIRYNTDQQRLESYVNGEWVGFPLVKTTFNYNGSDQTFTVPAGISKIWVKCWGAGGGGGGVSGWSGGGTGGGGGFASGQINTSGGTQYTIVVGQAGTNSGNSRRYGGGGQAPNTWGPGSGGGLSGIFNLGTAFGSGTTPDGTLSSRALIIAGGGGGGGANRNPNSTRGGAGGGTRGEAGSSNYGNNWGNGGTQNSAGTGNGGNGGLLSGANCNVSYGGGGGGGWYGGGAGFYAEPLDMGGGGGGSGFTAGSVVGGFTMHGSCQAPGGQDDPDRGSAGRGGNESSSGNNGLVVIYY